ncbi:MAG: hypothetical protein M3Q10_18480 [Chloroflexota bacterium]|nr:hypothetical protein [Chloroflexota bacterium]
MFENTLHGSATAMLRVARAGYRWGSDEEPPTLAAAPDREPAKWWLVENESGGATAWGERRAPLGPGHVPRLAADFAALRTPKGYLGFANKWGRLGHAGEREWLATWEKETRRALVLTNMMKWLGNEDREHLRSVVTWNVGSNAPVIDPRAALGDRPREAVPGVPWLDRKRIVEPDVLTRPDGRPRWRHGDVIGPAQFYVCDELNKAVRGHIQTKLMPFAAGHLFRIYIVPDCLRATIYYQLQLNYGRGLIGPRSKQCGRVGCAVQFEATGNKRYCSPECQKWGKSQSQARWRRQADDPELPQSIPQNR